MDNETEEGEITSDEDDYQECFRGPHHTETSQVWGPQQTPQDTQMETGRMHQIVERSSQRERMGQKKTKKFRM